MEPSRKRNEDIESEIRPDLHVIDGGGETTPGRGNLRAVSQGLSDAENNPSSSATKDANLSDQESKGTATPDTNFTSSFTGAKSSKIKLTSKVGKRLGLIGGGGGIIGLVLFFLGGVFPLGGLLLNLGETATAGRDTQSNIFTQRLYKVIDRKMSNAVTSGSCDLVKVACRFSRPSNALLTRLSEYGITSVNSSGLPIEQTRTGFPNEKPIRYEYTNSKGAVVAIEARDFASTLRSDPEFRKLFSSAYNMRYWGYADTFIKKMFYKKYGIDRSGKTTASIDVDEPSKSIQEIAEKADKDNPVRAAGDDDTVKENAAKKAITDSVEDELERSAKKVVKAKGDPILTAGAVTCLAMNTPGFVTKVVRAYQMRQEIAIAAAIVLTASSMLKAGDMSPETMTTIGTLLTATSFLASGDKSKSAMDSFGIKNILFNDTKATSNSYQKFIPGYAVTQQNKGINQLANSPEMKEACATINSPQAFITVTALEAGIGAGTAGVGAGVIAVLKAVGGGLIAIGAVDTVVKGIKDSGLVGAAIDSIFSSIPPEDIANLLGNADIESAKEEDLGNVVGAGINHYFSESALSTGAAAPLTTQQLARYDKDAQDTMIAYAEQERLGKSPFDVSSPYTFLGSIVSNYYQHAYVPGSVAKSIMSSIGYTLGQTTKLFSSNTYAATTNSIERCGFAEQFGVDPIVAIGAFSDPCVGIPSEFMDIPTDSVMNSVSESINPDSGLPTEDGDISLMLADCGSSDLLNIKGCTIEDQTRANQSIYMTDLRLNNILDEVKDDGVTPLSSADLVDTEDIAMNVPTMQYSSKAIVSENQTDVPSKILEIAVMNNSLFINSHSSAEWLNSNTSKYGYSRKTALVSGIG